MGSLSIRRLDEETLRGLRIRAAQHNVSMEEEARRILRLVVTSPARLGDMATRLFGAANGVDLALPRHAEHEPLGFDE
jgi:plasmid stability protein